MKESNTMRKMDLIDIYILEILETHASENRKMTQEQLINRLDNDYQIKVSRRTLSDYLSALREQNYIAGYRGFYKVNKFSDTELRLLIDGVLFGKHIPEEKASEIIDKLKSMSNENLKNRVRHVYYVKEMQHTDNYNLYEILDSLDDAIEHEKKVEITQCAYNTKGELVDRKTYIVSPYYIVTSKSMYYLICYAGRNNDVENRRVDRISAVKVLEEKRVPITELKKYKNGQFSLSKYMKEHIYMFSGDSERITLRIKKTAIGDVIDWYGKEYRILSEDGDYVTIKLQANSNAVYYWALQYGASVEVIEPIDLRERIRDGLKDILSKYECNNVDITT